MDPGVRGQPLERRRADFIVLTEGLDRWMDLQMVDHLEDPVDLACVVCGCPSLTNRWDSAAEHDRPDAVHSDGNQLGICDPPIVVRSGSYIVFDASGVGEHETVCLEVASKGLVRTVSVGRG